MKFSSPQELKIKLERRGASANAISSVMSLLKKYHMSWISYLLNKPFVSISTLEEVADFAYDNPDYWHIFDDASLNVKNIKIILKILKLSKKKHKRKMSRKKPNIPPSFARKK